MIASSIKGTDEWNPARNWGAKPRGSPETLPRAVFAFWRSRAVAHTLAKRLGVELAEGHTLNPISDLDQSPNFSHMARIA
eukprot:4560842-Prymnesium_polylepis.1